jgi:HAD superfamily hydrolase (TIGR01509 family)
MVAGVIFDMDGVLLDSEQVWNEVKRGLVLDWGGRWIPGAATEMMGMSSPEWSAHLKDRMKVDRPAAEIDTEVVGRMQARYAEGLPLLPGALEAVQRLAEHWPLGLASSSNRVLIDEALDTAGLSGYFAVTVSSEEVARGKPAPDVYLEAARALHIEPTDSVAIEDSGAGLRSAYAAGMRVIALPNPHFPPPPAAVALASVVLGSIGELTASVVGGL